MLHFHQKEIKMSQNNNENNDAEAPILTNITVKMVDPDTGAVVRCHYGRDSETSRKRIMKICYDDNKTIIDQQNTKLKKLEADKKEIEKKIKSVSRSLEHYKKQNHFISNALDVIGEEQSKEEEE